MTQQPGDLHRCRLAREGEQPVAGGVAREIDQDVDAVTADLCGKFRIAQTDRAVPVIGEVAESLGDGIGRRHFRIAMELHDRAIMSRQQWFGEQRNRVLAEIRRNVTDAQPPFGCPVEVK